MKQVTGNNPQYIKNRTSIQVNLDGFSVIYPTGEQESFVGTNLNFLQSLQNTTLQIVWNTPHITLIPSHLFNPDSAYDYLQNAGLAKPHHTPLYTLINNIVLLWNVDNNVLTQIDQLPCNTLHLHPLQLLLESHDQNNTTNVIINHSLVHIACTNQNQLKNTLSAPFNSSIDLLYYISQIAQPNTLLSIYGEIPTDAKVLIDKHYKGAKFYSQANYSLLNFHNRQ